MSGSVTFEIAGLRISFNFNSEVPSDRIHPDLEPLLTNMVPEITLHVHFESIPKSFLDLTGPSYISMYNGRKGLQIYDCNGEKVIQFFAGKRMNFCCDKLITMQPDLKSGDLYHDPTIPSVEPYIYTVNISILQTLLAVILSGKIIFIHSCGVRNNGLVTLYVGASGAGKSTMARLWGTKGARVLNEDRMIVRRTDDGFVAYSLPIGGNKKFLTCEKGLLKAMFLIKHSPENHLVRLKSTDAISSLFKYSSLFNSSNIQKLDFIEELTRKVPTYELGFVPESSVVDFIRNHDANP